MTSTHTQAHLPLVRDSAQEGEADGQVGRTPSAVRREGRTEVVEATPWRAGESRAPRQSCEGFVATAYERGSSIYEGWVMHRRLNPRHHRFKYRVFAMLLELDELAALDRKLALFKYNRWSLFSFQDRDHGDGRPLRIWLDDILTQSGIAAPGARRVLCYPRILGFVFNPISVWFCDDEAGQLKAIVYEVHNTYEERHAYVLRVENNNRPVRHGCAKNFYVSPFLSRDCRYNFRIRPPGQDVAIVIQEEEAGRPILNASFAGECRALSDRILARMLLRYPLMTLKVVLAIHFEAVRLMLKGIRRHPHQPKTIYAPAE